MTRIEAFNKIKPLDALAQHKNGALIQTKGDIVTEFFKWNHSIKIGDKTFPIEHGVLIVIICLAMYYTDGDFNDVYLRMVLETLKENRIYTTAQALNYMDDIVEQDKKNNRVSDGEDLWLDEVMSSLGPEWDIY